MPDGLRFELIAIPPAQVSSCKWFPGRQWPTRKPAPTMTKRDVTTRLAWSVNDR